LRILSVMHSNVQQGQQRPHSASLQRGDHDIYVGSVSFWVCAFEVATTHLKEPLAVGDIVSLSRPALLLLLSLRADNFTLTEEDQSSF